MKTFFISMCCVLTLVVQGAESTTIVSSAAQAGATGGGGSFQPVVQGAGRYVAFVSQANNLATNDNAMPHLDVFLRDRTAGVTVLVSVNSNGLGGGDDNSTGPALSADGRFVAFQSGAANLAGTDTNGASDVFLRDLLAGTTVLASHIPGSPACGNRASFGPLLSSSGNVVVYESGATNLVANDTNTTPDVFIYDRLTGTNALVSVNDAGNGSRAGTNLAPSITPDGRLVAYANFTGGPIPFPLPVRGHIFVRDMLAGTTTWASSNAMTGLPGYLGASGPALSSDGRSACDHMIRQSGTPCARASRM